MTDGSFVPDGFEPPSSFSGEGWRLEPLGPEHNERDHAAWTSSMEHIRATPGFAGRRWPHAMPLEDNLADLQAHADGFRARREFTYSVLDGDEVIGCVYLLPDLGHDAPDAVYLRCWVTQHRAALDEAVRDAVVDWVRTAWPFSAVRVDRRPGGS